MLLHDYCTVERGRITSKQPSITFAKPLLKGRSCVRWGAPNRLESVLQARTDGRTIFCRLCSKRAGETARCVRGEYVCPCAGQGKNRNETGVPLKGVGTYAQLRAAGSPARISQPNDEPPRPRREVCCRSDSEIRLANRRVVYE